MSKSATSVECPTCGRTDFKNETGMKLHHSKMHGETLCKVEVECAYCGERVTKSESDAKKGERNFCSQECYSQTQTTRNVVTVECEWCGSEFQDELGRNHQTKKYCSEGCRSKGHKSKFDRNTVECEQCGTEFNRKPSHESDRNFCSQDCMGEYRSNAYSGENNPNFQDVGHEVSQCGYCGDYFTHRRHGVNNYCSYECSGYSRSGKDSPHWKGGKQYYYGPNWNRQREKRIQLDGESCYICGMGRIAHKTNFNEDLHVHHIKKIRFFRDGDTVDYESANHLQNLVTMCRNCHYDWEGIPVIPQ